VSGVRGGMVVFTGPTLPPGQAGERLAATFLPPASQGDVYRATELRPWGIGIVDGYFERMPSVWHKEILWAMQRGVHVFGAASMGALRASELAAFGMEGVGAIFEAYRDGALEDDDEVAVLHGGEAEGWATLSEPLVNVRATLASARDAGVLDEGDSTALLEAARGLHYTERDWDRILERCPETPGEFRAWVPDGRVDQKRADAVAMLEEMRRRHEASSAPKRIRYRLNRSQFWEEARRRFALQGGGLLDMSQDAAEVGRGPPPDRPIGAARLLPGDGADAVAAPSTTVGAETLLPDAALEELRIRGRPYRRLRSRILARLLALEVAAARGLEVDEAFVDAALAALCRKHDLTDADALARWAREQGLGEAELERVLRDDAHASRVVRQAIRGLAPELADVLRVEGRYAALQRRARDKQRRLTEHGLGNPTIDELGGDEDALWDWFFRGHLDEERPADLERWAVQHDFGSVASLRRAALREYCYRRLVPAEEEGIRS